MWRSVSVENVNRKFLKQTPLKYYVYTESPIFALR